MLREYSDIVTLVSISYHRNSVSLAQHASIRRPIASDCCFVCVIQACVMYPFHRNLLLNA